MIKNKNNLTSSFIIRQWVDGLVGGYQTGSTGDEECYENDPDDGR
jgi:hypothetical protein